MTPPTFCISVGKFNSVEFRRYMADVLSQAVFKCVEIVLYSINREIGAVSRDSTSVLWAAAPLTPVNGGSKHWSPLQS